MKNIAAIDVGTNTFHLLIVSWDSEANQFKEIIRKRFFVKLGSKNISHIGPAAYLRGIQAMEAFNILLKQHKVELLKAYGTSAIRNADNADQFRKDVKLKTGIDIEKISGDKEAKLIYKGTNLSFKLEANPFLIMDIGGGSVEFIIADNNQMQYAQSFKVGVAILRQLFHLSEPILNTQIQRLQQYLKETLAPLITQLKKCQPIALIGASGTFDVLEEALSTEKISDSACTIDTSQLQSFADNIITKTLEERKSLNTIPNSRADLIVVALLLIEFVWNLSDFQSLVVTRYSMKEGMLLEMMEQTDQI